MKKNSFFMNILVLIRIIVGIRQRRSLLFDTTKTEGGDQNASSLDADNDLELLDSQNVADDDNIRCLYSNIQPLNYGDNMPDLCSAIDEKCSGVQTPLTDYETWVNLHEITILDLIKDDFLAFLDDEYSNGTYCCEHIAYENIIDSEYDEDIEFSDDSLLEENAIEAYKDKIFINSENVLTEIYGKNIKTQDTVAEADKDIIKLDTEECESNDKIEEISAEIMSDVYEENIESEDIIEESTDASMEKDKKIKSDEKEAELNNILSENSEEILYDGKFSKFDDQIPKMKIFKLHGHSSKKKVPKNKKNLLKNKKTSEQTFFKKKKEEKNILEATEMRLETDEEMFISDEEISDILNQKPSNGSKELSYYCFVNDFLYKENNQSSDNNLAESFFVPDRTNYSEEYLNSEEKVKKSERINDIKMRLSRLNDNNAQHINWFIEKLRNSKNKVSSDIVKLRILIFNLDKLFYLRIYSLNGYLRNFYTDISPHIGKHFYFNSKLMRRLKKNFLTNPFFRLKVYNANNLNQAINDFNKSVERSIKKIKMLYADKKTKYLIQVLAEIPSENHVDIFYDLNILILDDKNNKPLLELFPELHIIKEKIIRKDYQTDALKSIHQILTIILLQFEYYKENLLDAYKIGNKDSIIVCKIILSIRFLILSIFLECDNPKFITLHTFVLLFLNYLRCANKKLFLTLGFDDFIYENVFYMRFDKEILENLKIITYRRNRGSNTIEMTKMALDIKFRLELFKRCFADYFHRHGLSHLVPDFHKYYKKGNYVKIIEMFKEVKNECSKKFYKLLNDSQQFSMFILE